MQAQVLRYSAPWPKGLEEKQDRSATAGGFPNLFFPCRIVTALRKSCSDTIARRIASTTLEKIEGHRTQLFQNSSFSQVEIETADGATIYAAFAQGSVRKVILFAPGLNDCYEMLNDEKSVPQRFFKVFREMLGDISIMVVNRRGMGQKNSTLPTAKGLAIDVYSAAHYLIEKQQFTCEDLLIYGHSFGGMYAAQGTALLQKDFPKTTIPFVADRSFLSLPQVVEERLGGGIKGKIAKLFITFAQWDMTSLGDLTTIRGKKIIIFTRLDETVPYTASIHKLTEKLNIDNMIPFEMSEDKLSDWHHIREFTSDEKYRLGGLLKESLHMENTVL